MKKVIGLVLTSCLLFAACSTSNSDANDKNKNQSNQSEHKKHHKVVKDGRTYVDGILIVNKKISLPKDYNPGVDPKAQQALNRMIADASKEGLHITNISNFRSYQTQVSLYNNYVARDGKKAADKYSARPGYSEHQTGLTFDVGAANSPENLKTTFGNTKEGKWIKKNAHKYGFIVRYPKDGTHITGYQYEPWHLRYLGKKTATKVYDSGKTLEEYLGLYPEK
ncbi:M15 family metallopeptidase [Staphylococcus simiae]|uniref:M15 family metallopeptidase n=1 Tax=Staphylococcus simiae TaxID=308354 RepID=UPI001A967880|nr:M15 family metallopeptidase [Staphylococcus simiae]MBO1198903.1 M15 family metallopeptidase [Staphylococcus simiae]MBO1201071.1 M15 family metallopeptidase [Staphylococcus simiae]MBO1203303.1 M15 family metallopeptidase [Staphylococcus simiae]MBO1210748.1 M15 family metallopeptidase [Staphylococcus simiae]MBO1229409.1 M15 family metallopeptidase [Staphylococcus simiae]